MLVSLATYRSLTGDLDSYDGKVSECLLLAQSEIERLTSRKFEEGQYTEALPVHLARVYPSATPIASVSSPSGSTIEGTAIVVGETWLTGYSQVVVYIGGYDEDEVPLELQRLVAELARRLVTMDTAFVAPIGATSVKVGDISITGTNLGSRNPVDGPFLKRIRQWRRSDGGAL